MGCRLHHQLDHDQLLATTGLAGMVTKEGGIAGQSQMVRLDGRMVRMNYDDGAATLNEGMRTTGCKRHIHAYCKYATEPRVVLTYRQSEWGRRMAECRCGLLQGFLDGMAPKRAAMAGGSCNIVHIGLLRAVKGGIEGLETIYPDYTRVF